MLGLGRRALLSARGLEEPAGCKPAGHPPPGLRMPSRLSLGCRFFQPCNTARKEQHGGTRSLTARSSSARLSSTAMHGFEQRRPAGLPVPFQAALVDWALRKGRGAIFADCGLGKTPMQLVWAENVRRHTGKPVLIVTPLAVSFQTEAEAAKFGIEAAISRDGTIAAGITVTNYERLEHFDPDHFGGVVCDESSAIKAFDGERRGDRDGVLRKMPVPAALHGDRRAERLHRTGHVERGARLPRAHGHARPVLHEQATRPRQGRSAAGTAGQFGASSGGSRATPRSRSGGGSLVGAGDAQAVRPRVRRRRVHPAAARASPARRRAARAPHDGYPVRRARHRPPRGTRGSAAHHHRTVRTAAELARRRRRRASPGATSTPKATCSPSSSPAPSRSAAPTAPTTRRNARRVQPRRDPRAGHQAEDRRVGAELAALPPHDVLPLATPTSSTTRPSAAAGGSASSAR